MFKYVMKINKIKQTRLSQKMPQSFVKKEGGRRKEKKDENYEEKKERKEEIKRKAKRRIACRD